MRLSIVEGIIYLTELIVIFSLIPVIANIMEYLRTDPQMSKLERWSLFIF
jgi:hypothetical protein